MLRSSNCFLTVCGVTASFAFALLTPKAVVAGAVDVPDADDGGDGAKAFAAGAVDVPDARLPRYPCDNAGAGGANVIAIACAVAAGVAAGADDGGDDPKAFAAADLNANCAGNDPKAFVAGVFAAVDVPDAADPNADGGGEEGRGGGAPVLRRL